MSSQGLVESESRDWWGQTRYMHKNAIYSTLSGSLFRLLFSCNAIFDCRVYYSPLAVYYSNIEAELHL